MDQDPLAALEMDDGEVYSPSTDWSQGGPILEKITITKVVSWDGNDEDDEDLVPREWGARIGVDMSEDGDDEFWQYGPTPLVAIMRCYAAHMLGDEVEVPEELIASDVESI